MVSKSKICITHILIYQIPQVIMARRTSVSKLGELRFLNSTFTSPREPTAIGPTLCFKRGGLTKCVTQTMTQS